MRIDQFFLFAAIAASILTVIGCFPNFEANTVQRESISTIKKIESPTKAYLADASVVLFPNGFIVRNNTVTGVSRRYWIGSSDTLFRERSFSVDSIIAMTRYDSKISAGRGIASFLLGVTGSVMTPLSIYCISCPKCCFGSCPTIYINDEKHTAMQAELFSHSISKLLEDKDVDLLEYHSWGDTSLQLILTNEAMETHHINRFSLNAVRHPAGTSAFPSATNSFILFRDITPPSSAVSREGKDVFDRIREPDSLSYRTDITQFPFLAAKGESDWIEFRVHVPKTAGKVKMLIRLRNTLLSTTLFYDVVLGSQGIDALDWNHRMNTDARYAEQFRETYEAFSGVTVSTYQNGEWKKQCTFKDVGPITWKYLAAEIPVDGSDTTQVRVSVFPDNTAIDYVGFSTDNEASDTLLVTELTLNRIIDDAGEERQEMAASIISDDDKYLVTEPGDSYRFIYDVRGLDTADHTLFVFSQGYYTEWIRGSWLTNSNASYRFDITHTQDVLVHLVQSWMQNKDEIEHKFFESKIPTRRPK